MVELHKCSHCRSFKGGAGSFGGSSPSKHYPPDLGLEPVHLHIDLHVDLEHQHASGSVTTTLEARRPGERSLKLNFVDGMDIDVSDGAGKALTWDYDGKALAITWTEPFERGERRDLVVRYRVERPASGLFFTKPSEAYPDDPWCAMTDHETERARHWLPCIDLPSSRTTLEFHLRAEQRFTILANGALIEETAHDDGTKTAVWKLEQRCPSYLVCFAIGDFVCAKDGEAANVSLAYYTTQQYCEADLRRSFGRTGQMLEWMTDKLGLAFPFPKYYQIALPGIGGAMENISLVTWDDIFVLDETLALEWTWLLDQINVHEMAHSYFGDLVVCRDYAHAWLKESWATYMEMCWLEHAYGDDELLYDFYRSADAYFSEADDSYARPMVTREFSSSWQMYDNHLYPGGACRLHTLRCELGDEVFWGGVQSYLKTFGGKLVETEDFRRCMEQHSGRSLVHFFDQWIYRAGYPHIKVSFEYDDDKKCGTFEIEQTQAKGDDTKAFRLVTDVGWVIESTLHTRPLVLDKAYAVVVIPMASNPEQVRFDPLSKVLHKLSFKSGDNKLRRQLTHASDIVGRIQAAHELAQTGKRLNIKAIIDAYGDEGFWGVRQQFAKALGDAGTEDAIQGVVQILREEIDPMVLEAVFKSAGKYRDERLRDTIIDRLRKELPYRARMAAYEALGEQREAAPVELLIEAAQAPTFSTFPQQGALKALASTRDTSLVEQLLTWVEHGVLDHRPRAKAVEALGSLSRYLSKEQKERSMERLVDLLRDPAANVRNAAAYALGILKVPAAIPALERYGQTLSHQESVDVDEIIQGLRGSATPKVAALEKEIEQLRDKLRKLDHRLLTVEASAKPEDDA